MAKRADALISLRPGDATYDDRSRNMTDQERAELREIVTVLHTYAKATLD